jgi:hypothetical protein
MILNTHRSVSVLSRTLRLLQHSSQKKNLQGIASNDFLVIECFILASPTYWS